MTITLLLEQVFNGIQSGVTLFLVAAGLTRSRVSWIWCFLRMGPR